MSGWNGLPDQPERSGWHWLNDKLAAREALTLGYWSGGERFWMIGAWRVIYPKSVSGIFHYRGLCPSPSELAQMRKDERERCAEHCTGMMLRGTRFAEWNRAFQAASASIRSLTDDEGEKS